MNAVEIEEAVSDLALQPFDADEFPFAFLTAFGNKETTVRRLRAGSGNASDVPGGVLQRNNIHMAVCPDGSVSETLAALRASAKTAANKIKFILATDGVILEAEDLTSGEPIACEYPKFGDHFGFFLPLAGISTVKQIKNNPIDIKATGRLNKLYLELLKENPEWATAERRHDLNQFMARLIFCMFAEDTGIFLNHLFSKTVEQMSDSQSSNTHEVIAELFRAMNTPITARAAGNFRPWADSFPYVNGGLYAGNIDCPRFSRIARTYLLRAAELNWQEINPDIFGSMIQAVADDDERGELGMHYTSVPNILKVLNPLFLDDLRAQLELAGDSVRKLRALRRRIADIRIFDPACGSGNFLVISYIQLREIEAEIIKRADDPPKSIIKLENFYGIEIKSFAAEIARLALLIAEFQCDVRLINQREARLNVLPLHKTGQIHIGNALRENWLELCPPLTKRTIEEQDLGGPTGRLSVEDSGLDAEEPETYICGNPPYVGRRNQTTLQKADLQLVLGKKVKSSASLDYVFGWIEKASEYAGLCNAQFAFVTTNSVSQGTQIPIYWPHLLSSGLRINFAHRSFKWVNNASNNAGVTCVILGVGRNKPNKYIFDADNVYKTAHINPYLLTSEIDVVEQRSAPLSGLSRMNYGNLPGDGNFLTLTKEEVDRLGKLHKALRPMMLPLYGAQEFIQGLSRFCLWIDDQDLEVAREVEFVRERIENVRKLRSESKDASYNKLADRPHQFRDRNHAKNLTILAPTVSSESRDFLPIAVFPGKVITTNQAFALYDAPLWNMALLASRIHLVWIATVCGKLESRYRYSNTLGWNTFPVPPLTEKNKADLTRCAEGILLAREAHFPATIAELYNPANMPDNLRQAHELNDETLERIYIGRRFRNDTERLEKLFDLYTKMTTDILKKKSA